MMKYICNHYIKTPGGMYPPKTHLDVDDLTENEIMRLVRSGAVSVIEENETANDEAFEESEDVSVIDEDEDVTQIADTEIVKEPLEAELDINGEAGIEIKPKKRGKK